MPTPYELKQELAELLAAHSELRDKYATLELRRGVTPECRASGKLGGEISRLSVALRGWGNWAAELLGQHDLSDEDMRKMIAEMVAERRVA